MILSVEQINKDWWNLGQTKNQQQEANSFKDYAWMHIIPLRINSLPHESLKHLLEAIRHDHFLQLLIP